MSYNLPYTHRARVILIPYLSDSVCVCVCVCLFITVRENERDLDLIYVCLCVVCLLLSVCVRKREREHLCMYAYLHISFMKSIRSGVIIAWGGPFVPIRHLFSGPQCILGRATQPQDRPLMLRFPPL